MCGVQSRSWPLTQQSVVYWKELRVEAILCALALLLSVLPGRTSAEWVNVPETGFNYTETQVLIGDTPTGPQPVNVDLTGRSGYPNEWKRYCR